HAGVALAWPFEINGLNPIEREGKTLASTEQMPRAAFLRAGPGYFEALGVPLLRGRAFTSNDRANEPAVAVVNEEFAHQFFGAQDPVGQHVRVHYPGEPQPTEPWATIVGVVGATRSIRYDQIQWDRYPAIYTSMFQQQETGKMRRFDAEPFYFYVQGAADSRLLSAAVHAADPALPIGEVRSTGQVVSELRAQPRLRARMLGLFAVFTLLLAAIGVYGVMVQFVEQRRREIGIRVALGALHQNIIRLILRRALILAGVGILAGIVGTAALTRVMRSLLYNVSPLDPMIFAAVVGILAAVALLASYLPARRALKIEPTEALKAE
ncbi:MAG TPA: FtsX-like permease family protein, partial [Candidatus Limnocylindrales bacterium]|nr:FtsX-like permease family protein [Candidatus Limnocylindrales bacterium]